MIKYSYIINIINKFFIYFIQYFIIQNNYRFLIIFIIFFINWYLNFKIIF
jgi:hypothetical protein